MRTAPARSATKTIPPAAIGAVGMLVQAETREDLEAVADLADGLSILPASASDIAKALGISHYPVLISAHGIEQ